MIDGGEELMNVALEDEAVSCAIAAHAAQHSVQGIRRFMRPFPFPTGEGMSNKGRLEDGIEHRENSMVQDTVLHGRLVNAALLWVTDRESAIRLMSIGSGGQLSVQAKKILLQRALELLHVLPALLPFAKFLPRREEGFLGSDPLEDVPKDLHYGIVTGLVPTAAPLTEIVICYKLYQGVLSEHRQGLGAETSILRPFRGHRLLVSFPNDGTRPSRRFHR